MYRTNYLYGWLVLFVFLSACSEKPVEIDLTVTAKLNGQAVASATVTIDGVDSGVTDSEGVFKTKTSKLKSKKILVEVVKNDDEFKTKPWKGEFQVELAKGEEKQVKDLDVTLKNYITLVVSSKEGPLSGVKVSRGKEEVGTTDEQGRLDYEFISWPKKGLRIKVDKKGYVAKNIKFTGKSGKVARATILERAVIQLRVLSAQDDSDSPIKGASVYLGKKLIGRTGSDGSLVYRHKGKHGYKDKLKIVTRGYIPSVWSKTITLEGKQKYSRHFYTAKPQRIKTGVYSFVSNTSGEDISEVVKKAKERFSEKLFSESKAFEKVPDGKLVKLVRDSKLSLEKLKSRGWKKNRLSRNLDLLVFGSVARNEKNDFIVEVNFYRKDGTLVLSHVATSGSDSDWRIGRAVGEVVDNVMERYPFEGMVTEVTDDNYKINLGDKIFPISRNDFFEVRAVRKNSVGKITKTSAIGKTEVDRARSQYTTLEPMKEKVRVGYKVVRVDSAINKTSDTIQLSVKGGVGNDMQTLPGVNVYANEIWVGITNSRGSLKVPARIGRDVDLVLYKHGYKQVIQSVEAEKKDQNFDFTMTSYTSKLTIASNPPGASVFMNDKKIGVTPMKPYSVSLGFHTIRLQLGGEYRDWEEVIEFNQSEENRKITLFKDHVLIAEKLQSAGKVDAAIAQYQKANSQHPDYAEARHRLAQLYLDEKRDYDAAIREFETVQQLPEVKDLVLKQYAVVYTNLGHAYYAKGDSILDLDKKEAARNFAKAIKALNTAKENSRFFPNESYDEILHDTYYYIAIAYHNLYKLSKKDTLLNSADLAWQQYFDYFPSALETNGEYLKIKGAAQRLWDELKTESKA